MAAKTCHYTHHVEYCSTIDAPSRHKTTTVISRDFWGPALSIPRRPPHIRLDPASTNCRSTKEQCLHVRWPQDPGSFTVPSLTPPRYSGDGRPFLEHIATASFIAPVEPSPLRHHPRVSSTPLPPPDPIKGKAGDPPRDEGRQTTKDENHKTFPSF
jgi:hypothetical protein